MKGAFRLLTFLLCLELILGPINPQFSLMIQKASAAQSCPTGFSFDTVLNRCLSKDETTKVLNATSKCAPGDTQCYKNNAIQAFQKKVNEGEAPERVENQDMMSTAGNALAVAGPVMVAMSGVSKSASTCTSVSFWGMVIGSVAFVVGDNLANFMHKSRLDKIKKSWGKIVNPEHAKDKDQVRDISMEAQSQAFGKLAEAEESMAKAAKMKQMFFYAAAAAYAVSTVAAAMEIAAENTDKTQATRTANTCAPKGASINQNSILGPTHEGLFYSYIYGTKKPFEDYKFINNLKESRTFASLLTNKKAMDESYSSPSIDYYNELQHQFSKHEISKDQNAFEAFKEVSMMVLNNLNPLNSALAEEKDKKKQNVDSNAAKAYKEDEGKGINLMGIGAGLVIGAAAGKLIGKKLVTAKTRAIFSGVMTGWTVIMAMHAGKQAKASTARAELLRKMQNEFNAVAGSITSCRSEDREDPGKPNCYCYTSENQRNPNRTNSAICQKLWTGVTLTASNYTGAPQNTKVCINQQRQADPKCACRANNSCMKASVNGLKGINTGTFQMMSSSLTPVNELAKGNGANLDVNGMANNVARLQKLSKQLEGSKQLKDAFKNKKNAEVQLKNELQKISSSIPNNNLLGNNGSSGLPSNPADAAKMLEKELLDNMPRPISGSGDTIAAPSSSDGGEEKLDFGLKDDDAITEEDKISEAMKDNLDYGSNDISDSSASIFDVVSNRYRRSGMRRLFSEGEMTSEIAADEETAETVPNELENP